MKNDAPELLQAIRDAGWESDPLAERIRTFIAAHAEPRAQTKLPWLLGAITAAALAVAITWGVTDRMHANAELAAARTECATMVAQRDQEIQRLRDLTAAQIAESTAKIQAALSAANVVSQNNATLAESTQSTLKLLLDEVTRLRATAVPPSQPSSQPVAPKQ